MISMITSEAVVLKVLLSVEQDVPFVPYARPIKVLPGL